ncbi:enoyl-CoA hydratase/isomerase family protein [Haladaptatus sp. GCM10025893]|uniref:enoyl-CoA hydratase/isomerase family protein n=1 Tax=Haladaptatus sp. GCM10025893 TaxID=3252659 RepID=UPI003610F185
MAYETILVERDAGRATVTLNRPEKLNAMTGETFVELHDAFREFADEDLDVVTIRGAGDHFSAGVDMAGVPEWAQQKPIAVRDNLEVVHDALRTIEGLDVPIVAAIDGYALGGGLELTLACDIRVASHRSKFGLPEANMGLAMDLGGAQKLPGMIGEGMTKWLIMTGKNIDAQRAFDVGLVEQVAAEGEFDAMVADLEDTLAEKPTYVLGIAKRQVHSARPSNLDEAMNQAIHHALTAYQEDETQRRVTEFLDRRAPAQTFRAPPSTARGRRPG